MWSHGIPVRCLQSPRRSRGLRPLHTKPNKATLVDVHGELVISYLFQREMRQRLGNQSTFPTRAAGIEALASAAAHRVLLAESWNAGQRRGCNPETARQVHGPWVPQPALLVTTAAGVPLLASDAACSSTGLVTNCGSSRRKVSSSCK